MPCMYILYSEKLKKYYVGACIDIERRLYEHNIGHSKFTALGVPWFLKYTEDFETLPEAKKRELSIKRMKSRKYIEGLIAKGIPNMSGPILFGRAVNQDHKSICKRGLFCLINEYFHLLKWAIKLRLT